MFGRSWIRDNTSRSSCHDVEFGFTTDIFITIWIRHRELMTTFAATCSKDLTSSNRERSSEESVSSESFSFLKLSEHDKNISYKSARIV